MKLKVTASEGCAYGTSKASVDGSCRQQIKTSLLAWVKE